MRLNRSRFFKGKKFKEDDLIHVHHLLMKWYGWIPLEEFQHLPTSSLWSLYQLCVEEEKRTIDWRKMLLKALGAKVK